MGYINEWRVTFDPVEIRGDEEQAVFGRPCIVCNSCGSGCLITVDGIVVCDICGKKDVVLTEMVFCNLNNK